MLEITYSAINNVESFIECMIEAEEWQKIEDLENAFYARFNHKEKCKRILGRSFGEEGTVSWIITAHPHIKNEETRKELIEWFETEIS